jgi:hypothetical protein
MLIAVISIFETNPRLLYTIIILINVVIYWLTVLYCCQ